MVKSGITGIFKMGKCDNAKNRSTQLFIANSILFYSNDLNTGCALLDGQH